MNDKITMTFTREQATSLLGNMEDMLSPMIELDSIEEIGSKLLAYNNLLKQLGMNGISWLEDRKPGVWKKTGDKYLCSDCGAIAEPTPFCPWCGADMRGREYPCYSPPDGSQLFTNADRIRAMTDEELAEYLYDRGNGCEYCYGICAYQYDCNDFRSQEFCVEQIVKWLNQDYKGDNNEVRCGWQNDLYVSKHF